MLGQQNHAAGGANGSIMVVVFVCLCLASKKPSEREFFVPAGTDFGVKLLKVILLVIFFSSFNDVDPSHMMLVDCCVLCCRVCGPIVAV
jgi:hypothetical protein